MGRSLSIYSIPYWMVYIRMNCLFIAPHGPKSGFNIDAFFVGYQGNYNSNEKSSKTKLNPGYCYLLNQSVNAHLSAEWNCVLMTAIIEFKRQYMLMIRHVCISRLLRCQSNNNQNDSHVSTIFRIHFAHQGVQIYVKGKLQRFILNVCVL